MKYILMLSFLFISCNTKVLVNKTRIVSESEGYLFYYRSNKCLFIPSKDTSITRFMNDTFPKKGYLLGTVCGIDGLKFLSQKFDVNMVYMNNKEEYTLPDSIYLTTIRFKYTPNKQIGIDFSDIIEFEYMGRKYRIYTSDSFNGEILKVVGNVI